MYVNSERDIRCFPSSARSPIPSPLPPPHHTTPSFVRNPGTSSPTHPCRRTSSSFHKHTTPHLKINPHAHLAPHRASPHVISPRTSTNTPTPHRPSTHHTQLGSTRFHPITPAHYKQREKKRETHRLLLVCFSFCFCFCFFVVGAGRNVLATLRA